MNYSPPGSSIQEISQARILEWVIIPFSRGSSWPRDQTHVSCTAGRFFTTEPPGKPLTCIISFQGLTEWSMSGSLSSWSNRSETQPENLQLSRWCWRTWTGDHALRILCLQTRVSQSRHSWHLGPENSLLSVGGYHVPCRMFTCFSGVYPQGASDTPKILTTKDFARYCQMTPGGSRWQNSPQVRATDLDHS